jgi:hypothetical protein
MEILVIVGVLFGSSHKGLNHFLLPSFVGGYWGGKIFFAWTVFRFLLLLLLLNRLPPDITSGQGLKNIFPKNFKYNTITVARYACSTNGG